MEERKIGTKSGGRKNFFRRGDARRNDKSTKGSMTWTKTTFTSHIICLKAGSRENCLQGDRASEMLHVLRYSELQSLDG